MKKFLLTLILIFNVQSLTNADDIRDFEIEKLSIGESALKFFTESELKKNVRQNQYQGSDGKFYDVQVRKYDFDIYDEITLVFKKSDKNYEIYSIGGIIYYGNQTKKCLSDYKKILNEIENIFPNHTKDSWKNQKHHQDPSGKSLVNGTLMILESEATAEVACYSWSDEMKLEDYVLVAINSKEFENWLINYLN